MIVLALMAVTVAADPKPALNAVEQSIVGARESIRDCHLVIEIESSIPQFSPTRTRYRYETWLEKDRQRTEITPLDEATRSAHGLLSFPRLSCRNCPEPGQNLGLLRGGSPIALTKLGEPNIAGANAPGAHLDVRRLGVVFGDSRTLKQFPLHKSIAISQLPGFAQDVELQDGKRLIRMSGQPREGVVKTIWVDPDCGPCVVKIEAKGRNQNLALPDFYSVMKIEPARDEHSGAWYFRSYTWRSTLHGGNNSDETGTVKLLEINRGIDPEVFSWAGLMLPTGTPMQRGEAGKNGSAYWDGTKLVEKKLYQQSPDYQKLMRPAPASPVDSTSIPSWQIAMAVLFAVAGGMIVVWYIRRL